MGLRQDKFAKQIQRDLAELMTLHRNEWLGGTFVTMSNVLVSPDLSYVKVYLSLFNIQNRKDVLNHLNTVVDREIRHEIARRIKNNVKKIPEIRFYEDDTLDYVAKMDELFDKIKSEGNSNPSENQ
jgi:ribosome-binding factor A